MIISLSGVVTKKKVKVRILINMMKELTCVTTNLYVCVYDVLIKYTAMEIRFRIINSD